MTGETPKEEKKKKNIFTLLTSTIFPLVSTDSGSHPHSLTNLATIYLTSNPIHSKELSRAVQPSTVATIRAGPLSPTSAKAF